MAVLTAEELHRRGVRAMNTGRLAAATRLLQRALGAADPDAAGDAVRARIEASLAYVAADDADLATALRRCEQALDFPDLPDDVRGVLLCQRAVVLRRCGHPARALDSFARAIESLHDLPEELGPAYLNRGTVHLDVGDPAAAVADFVRAGECYAQVGAELSGAMAAHNRGYALLLSGDLVGALAAMEEARPALEAAGPMVAAVSEQDRAEVLMAAGLVADGTALMRRAADRYGARRLRQRQGEAELALAGSLRAHDPAAARIAARRARRRFATLGSAAWRARADAEVAAAEIDLGGRSPRLLALLDEVATELREQGLRWPAVATTLRGVRVLTRRGRVAEARERLAGIGSLRAAPLAVRLLHREVCAELAAATGRRADALRQLRVGVADLHAWQSSFGSLDLQTGVASHAERLGGQGLRLAVESGRPAVLLEWSERARMLASRVQPVRAPDDAELVADLAELRRLASEEAGADPVRPVREAELRRRVRERAWQHHGSGEVTDPVTLAALRAGLDAQTALVAYVVTASRMVALVVSAAGTTRVDLGPRRALDELLGGLLPDLDVAAADHLPTPLSGAVRGALGVRLDRLASLLVMPVLAAVGERRVVLTPSSTLAGVPWPLLPGYVGRPVTVAQSATSWLARRTTPLRTARAGFVAGPRVARAEDEVLAAARQWDGARVILGAAATAAAVSELAEQVDVLHVAAHGRHSSENPMFSGLTLADGPWFGYDVDRLRAVPDVVLLSACEVGRSSVRWGEELIGMAGAWLHAGARCVVASAAAVNDAAAYDVLVAVHRQLAAGVDPAAALAGAVPAVSADRAPVPLVCFG